MVRRATILIVDDQALVRRTVRAFLAQQPDWHVYEASDGQSALERIPKIHPDVVVLDLVMPEMSGLELACKIRQLELPPRIVLISSHYTPEEASILARLFGDGGLIQKSEIDRKLIPAIKSLLPKKLHPRVVR